jgi:hypothetical protein
MKLLRRVSGDNFAHAQLAVWLGLPGPERPSPTPRSERVLTGQAVARHGGAGLRLDINEASVVKDLGGSGEGNGVLDAGEWVELELGVGNPTSRPYFSTSFRASSASSCVWVDELAVDPMVEMNPGAKSDSVSLWVYLSNSCAMGTKATISLRVEDTHRTRSSSEFILLDLIVTNRNNARLLPRPLDSDHPGSSDGSGERRLVGGQMFEFSSDVQLPDSGARRVSGRYHLSAPSSELLSGAAFRKGVLYPLGGGRYGAFDDLDIVTQDEAKFRSGVIGLQQSDRAPTFDGKDNRLWGVFDAVAVNTHPGPSKREVVRKNGQPGVPLDEGSLRKIIQDHLYLEPRSAIPKASGAVEATDGYELVVDWAELLGRYAARVAPTPGEEKVVEKAVDALYRHRLYFSIPVQTFVVVAEICDNKVDDDLDGLIDRRDPDCMERACEDGVDNDGDGLTDLRDPDCQFPEVCDDGRDNDGDGLVDREDSDCWTTEFCDDGMDNDGDGDVDLDDTDCQSLEDCFDGIDNDGDGAIDVDDSDCVEVCGNGRDDDGDGLADCRDSDCPACESMVRFDLSGGVEIGRASCRERVWLKV